MGRTLRKARRSLGNSGWLSAGKLNARLYRREWIVNNRASGVLLHISSLPGKYGIGDLGSEAYKFADFLVGAGQSYWQILPLSPVMAQEGFSPYISPSAFAGNTWLISPELLYKDGLLGKEDLRSAQLSGQGRVDYRKVGKCKDRLLARAFECSGKIIRSSQFRAFVDKNKFWLEDFATFMALRQRLKFRPWNQWPLAIKNRRKRVLQKSREELLRTMQLETFKQYLFFRQWSSLKQYCSKQGLRIIGDIPIYVALDSADVWSHPELFQLTKDKMPRAVAGVPPDYFSPSGQLWGNPLYDWAKLKSTGYSWWIERLKHNLRLFDMVRIDHFRGLIGYWAVPAGHKTAVKGQWRPGPKMDFFKTVLRHVPRSAFLAEDLGQISPEVRRHVERLGLPGMRVLLFAFDGHCGTSTHAPHNHVRHCVVYTGTHDNNTVRGWFEKEATARQRQELCEYLGRTATARKVHTEFVRLAMGSVGELCIIPMQDILGLGAQARMNRPGNSRANWRWRLPLRGMSKGLAEKLAKLSQLYGRARRTS